VSARTTLIVPKVIFFSYCHLYSVVHEVFTEFVVGILGVCWCDAQVFIIQNDGVVAHYHQKSYLEVIVSAIGADGFCFMGKATT